MHPGLEYLQIHQLYSRQYTHSTFKPAMYSVRCTLYTTLYSVQCGFFWDIAQVSEHMYKLYRVQYTRI